MVGDSMPFLDRELGVYTSTRVLEQREPVLVVFHDRDGDWQFLSGKESEASEAMYVHIEHLLSLDSTLELIASLPIGWKAWRQTIHAPWSSASYDQSRPAI